MSDKKRALVLVDFQESFCNPLTGSLYVDGADKDAERMAKLINTIGHTYDTIWMTLDSHQPLHIAHPDWWVDARGNHPNPITIITPDDVKNGKWTTTHPGLYKRSLDYVEKLAVNGRYQLCIWPPHCEIGTPGGNIVPPVYQAVRAWSIKKFRTIIYKPKGSNPFTENYSVIKADVPDASDPGTQTDMDFIRELEDHDQIDVGGEADSHCVLNTFKDIVDNASDPRKMAAKMVLISDCTSSVKGFEHLADAFHKDMLALGVRITTTKDLGV